MEYTTTVTVSNVAPTATFGIDGSVINGTATFIFTNSYDPGINDNLLYSFDWENDGIYDIIDQTSNSAEHTWSNGDHSVKGMIKDNDGDYTEYVYNLTVS